MGLFNKLPGHARSPAGIERTLLRCMPVAFVLGPGLLMLPSLVLRVSNWGKFPVPFDAIVFEADIYALSAVLLYCNLTILITLWALTVMLAKGPAYVADAYPLIDADAPRIRLP